MQNRVLIGPSTFAALDPAPKQRLLNEGLAVIDNPFRRKLTKDELLELLPGVIGLIAGLEVLDREVLEKSDLKVVSRCGSGMSNVDLAAAEALGIKVFCTPFGPTTAVAELTLGALLCLLRNIPQMNEDLHHLQWNKRIGHQLAGKTAVVIGFGRIGQRVTQLLMAFGARVLAVDPGCPGGRDEVEIIDLDKALARADIITLHCSGDAQLLGVREFGLMKPGAFLLNAARGTLIDEAALISALEGGVVAGAWLDTFGEEPYQGPLTGYRQVLLSPHVGSYTAEGRLGMEMEAADNLISGLGEVIRQ